MCIDSGLPFVVSRRPAAHTPSGRRNKNREEKCRKKSGRTGAETVGPAEQPPRQRSRLGTPRRAFQRAAKRDTQAAHGGGGKRRPRLGLALLCDTHTVDSDGCCDAPAVSPDIALGVNIAKGYPDCCVLGSGMAGGPSPFLFVCVRDPPVVRGVRMRPSLRGSRPRYRVALLPHFLHRVDPCPQALRVHDTIFTRSRTACRTLAPLNANRIFCERGSGTLLFILSQQLRTDT